MDQERLGAWLDLYRLKRVGGLPGAETGPFHASGHIHGQGMEWLIETINPERILPVHTQKRGWFEARWPERVVAVGFSVDLLRVNLHRCYASCPARNLLVMWLAEHALRWLPIPPVGVTCRKFPDSSGS